MIFNKSWMWPEINRWLWQGWGGCGGIRWMSLEKEGCYTGMKDELVFYQLPSMQNFRHQSTLGSTFAWKGNLGIIASLVDLKSWKLGIVFHLDVWSILCLGDKAPFFPFRENLGKLCGQTSIIWACLWGKKKWINPRTFQKIFMPSSIHSCK